MIPVAVGGEVDPGGISIPPYENKVITDPVPEVDKPEQLVKDIMSRVLIGKLKNTSLTHKVK